MLRPLALLLLSVVVAACQSSSSSSSSSPPPASSAKDKLTVAYIALNATQMPSWVAKEQGIFDKNGLDVDLQYISSGQSPTAALISGPTQVMVLGEQAIQADVQGADIVYVAAPTSTIFFSLYARPDITSAEQLRGKNLGITQAGSSSDTASKMALRSLGLERGKDVNVM